MQYKQEIHKLGASTVPRTLIWPIVYRDIDPLPDMVKNINYLDYSDFNVVGEAFFKSEKSLKFQEKLQEDICSIVDIINNVPDMHPDFETADGQASTLKQLVSYFESRVGEADDSIQKPISW